MYAREYNGKVLNFEASGGLINSSLVMQDFETDSYWEIMTGESIAGDFKGTKMVELPVGKKVQWKEWVAEHPETLVLSVDGREDGHNPYGSYFSSAEGFRGSKATDKRLKTKTPVFAFKYAGKSYAAPHSAIENGQAFPLGDRMVFLYRPRGAQMFYSTLAFVSGEKGFAYKDKVWADIASGCSFDAQTGAFAADGASCPNRLSGFDTFWYNWSLNNPETIVLKEGYTQKQ